MTSSTPQPRNSSMATRKARIHTVLEYPESVVMVTRPADTLWIDIWLQLFW